MRNDLQKEKKEDPMMPNGNQWSNVVSTPEIAKEQANASQMSSKKLPRLYITVQSQQQRDQELNHDMPMPSQLVHISEPPPMPKSDRSVEVGGNKGRSDAEFSQPEPRSQLEHILLNRPVLTPVSSRNTDLCVVDQQTACKHMQLFNPSPVATGMYFPFSNERNDFPQTLVPSSLASTLAAFLPPTSLNLPGPLFVLHPITSGAVFSPPNLCTTISLTPVMASTPQAKLPVSANNSQLPVEQLGVANVTQLSSLALLSSSSSSASSSFNLDQFLDFGQQSSSVLPPINSSSLSPLTFASSKGSVAVFATSETSSSSSTVTASNKRGIARKSSEVMSTSS